jgi:hypothetical protein
VKTAVALDLAFESIEKVALEFGNPAAAQASHVNVIALRAPLVIMFLSVQVH